MKDEIKEIDITKDLYLCSPLLNTECTKENCYINNGPCCHTVNKEHSQQYLLNYITNLQEKYERMKENAEILSNGCNELEQRNEKAIEYIENAQERDGDEESCSLHVPTLKSILEGRSDE